MQNTAKNIILLTVIILAIMYNPNEQPPNDSEYVKHLQEKLKKAIKEENFEEACRLRDKINAIQRV